VILGGGPAGCAAALSLAGADPRPRVLLVEATDYDSMRPGETLAPGGRALLEALGCWERFRRAGFLESHGTAARWGGTDVHENEFLLSARGNAWHLDRSRFDALLAARVAEAGADVRRGTAFVAATRENGTWSLTLRSGNATRHIEAGFVIDATGRAARFATRQGARRETEDRLVGISSIYRFPDASATRDHVTLVEAAEDGWWYSAPLPDARLVVAWMSDADLVRAARVREQDGWSRHLARSGPTVARVADGTLASPPRAWPAATQSLSPVHGEGWVATGDAAVSWDPLSSAGILKALRTGRLAGYVALDHWLGRPGGTERYARLLRREHEAYQAARAWFYGLEGRWSEAPFWARRLRQGGAGSREDPGRVSNLG
jgi:flavin-dependent dehydrogenase